MLKGISILIADDNKLNQKIATFALEKYRASCTAVFNGKEAIDQLNARRYDVILMDIQMPEMDGLEATMYIRRELGLQLPIIGLTANNLFGETENCVEAGMNTCISKPFDPEELSALILQLINQPQG